MVLAYRRQMAQKYSRLQDEYLCRLTVSADAAAPAETAVLGRCEVANASM